VGVQEVRWYGGGTEAASEYTFFYEKGNENHELGTGLFVQKGIISAVKRVEFVGDRMSYIILRRCWCDIILHVHAPTEDKIDDMKDTFYILSQASKNDVYMNLLKMAGWALPMPFFYIRVFSFFKIKNLDMTVGATNCFIILEDNSQPV
jgi:hypothetical protein